MTDSRYINSLRDQIVPAHHDNLPQESLWFQQDGILPTFNYYIIYMKIFPINELPREALLKRLKASRSGNIDGLKNRI